jgi:hypothetical protein
VLESAPPNPVVPICDGEVTGAGDHQNPWVSVSLIAIKALQAKDTETRVVGYVCSGVAFTLLLANALFGF